jgi:ArsR family transcriptional regulator, virulence genes transcriptional regulator
MQVLEFLPWVIMDTEFLLWAESQASLFRIFNNANRILILCALDDKEMYVGEIANKIDASVQNTSQHLRVMKDRGILTSRREGQLIYYRLIDHALLKQCGLTPRIIK